MICLNCGGRAIHNHHCLYSQEIRRVARSNGRPFSTLAADKRNLIPLCAGCHSAHHNRTRPLELWVLPNEVYAFARDLLGAGAAYEYLIRRYVGEDERAAGLLAEWVTEQAA